MEADTERTDGLDGDEYEDHGDVEAYWRRRVYVLAGGIALIGLLAWACSGSGHKKQAAQVRDAAATTSPRAALSAPAGTAATPTPAVTVTVTATPAATPARHEGDQCDPRDVVVGVTPSATAFRGKQHPRFSLSVVNTGRRTCTFDVGPKAMRVRITSGSDRVWSSDRCVDQAGANLQMLKRGVPYLATLDWNRRRCDGETRAAAGTYVIAVGAPGIRTQREVFRLR